MGAVIAEWLPMHPARIEIERGESISITVGDVGQVTLKPLADQEGRPTTVQGTMAQAAFQSASMQLASSRGTRWTDTDLRGWDGDSGTLHTFAWSA
jgi:hypothetical protein